MEKSTTENDVKSETNEEYSMIEANKFIKPIKNILIKTV